ncbi:MAG: BREX-3 system phosphatase PglZ [Anaerolineae bacterium]|nr:BREX-3 system phosphatase PglZ [Anaerolineae bacterium]
MTTWQNTILQHFTAPVHKLTLVADPDGLMLDEHVLFTIRQRGFDLLTFDDPVSFRYTHESGYRRHWDEGRGTDLVVILRSPEVSLRALPYDLLQCGRLLAFGLPELFPKLSYPVLKELELGYLQPIYEACQHYAGPDMGDQATARFVLRHAYGIDPDAAATPVGLLKLLLARHSNGGALPPRIRVALLAMLRPERYPVGWDVETWLHDANAFLAFLQEQWYGYLAALQPAGVLDQEPGVSYVMETTVPFTEPDVRAHIATLFLDGKLRPLQVPYTWNVGGWRQIGVQFDAAQHRLRRFTGLIDRLANDIPSNTATHHAWLHVAERWADLTVLYHNLADAMAEGMRDQYHRTHLEIESRFADWMRLRYHTLHSLPYLPKPAMVHHVPHWMASRHNQDPKGRYALVVVDGLALDQWQVIRSVWTEEAVAWHVDESATFAWVPTLTPISRQALFAGNPPKLFPGSWTKTAQDAAHWTRFWSDRGLQPANIGYLRNLGTKAVEADAGSGVNDTTGLETELRSLVRDPRIRVVGLVVNTVDNVMHGMQLGTSGMHQQVRLWLTRYRYLTEMMKELMDNGFNVCLTSDHGNVAARGIGRPSEGVLVETRGERARIYTDPAFMALGKQQAPTAMEWSNVGLPADLAVLLAPKLDAFVNVGEQAVCHGGIAIEEVIVPFVEITRGDKL